MFLIRFFHSLRRREKKKVKGKIPFKETRKKLVLVFGLREFAFPFYFCDFSLYQGPLCARKQCRTIRAMLLKVQWSYEKC